MIKLNPRRFDRLMVEHDGRCVYCGVTVKLDSDTKRFLPSRDHDIPKCRLGVSGGVENIVLSCGLCNEAKDNMTGDEYRHFLETGRYHPDYVLYLEDTSRRRLRGRVCFPSNDLLSFQSEAVRRAVERRSR